MLILCINVLIKKLGLLFKELEELLSKTTNIKIWLKDINKGLNR